jgi:hypothetical protein
MKTLQWICLLFAVLIGFCGCMHITITADNESKVLVIQSKPVTVTTDAKIPLGTMMQ